MDAEEIVFTIPELRLYILQFLIHPYQCFKCGYIPKKKFNIHKNTVYFCEWCDPHGYCWNPNTMNLEYH